MTRHSKRLLLTAGIAGFALLLSACAPQSEAETAAAAPAEMAEPGDSIPEVDLHAGFSPYADELLAVAGIENGYFDEVGITISPEPNGEQVDLIAALTPLLNKQIEVGSGYPPAIVSQLDSVDNVVTFAISDVFYGYRILAPAGEYTTLAEAMEGGESYGEAVATVVEQLRGQPVILREGVVPTFYELILEKAGMTLDDLEVTYLANPDIVRAGFSGQADFTSPTGAAQITSMELDGWEPIIELRDVIDNEPSEATVSLRSTFSGYLTTTEYAADNYETLLRFTSVVYRLIDDLEADPEGTVERFRDYLNSYTGSEVSTEELASMFDGLYSMRNFEDASELYLDEGEPFYFDEVMGAQIDDLAETGVIGTGHTPDSLSIAGQVYRDLVQYREAADEALVDAPDGDLKSRAQEQYDHRNYLDAYRLAAAAAS
ncbi:hypothetical protein MUN78_12250 [Leucobacter allii]|uniref:ABC transporter substrate-binding protein n=1 Tax=Leucobacter allii TaxID=2932247 RepID=A0ABY4FJY6_9MICO|nr:hypothetical protein [Leucobacter allii]UOQ56442.1 hypothetical protein MUN78_12250 [Leucobacter allii]